MASIGPILAKQAVISCFLLKSEKANTWGHNHKEEKRKKGERAPDTSSNDRAIQSPRCVISFGTE